ncbi:hypothetical protein A2697_01555 [Candidatus Curtissbacteria bacterium RIFCSPHIGHO2_01_FULL_41_44]|uniref:Glycosyltransferase RgtA/B/C/D-like domain-containing protein n=1 Tax=Candidatus Curtissbacteria bacterium RIFCSPLOWO2_01_FULL_42_50 TaxID=1797730 RepID=A0A1F5H614_9BACT|nr:MAG: hypothetical protein A2697_01555 [Candidatus Curtissbacteria bacterium RIFCSPHIGHO2_01_FULL_41_44]OGD99616.1 MAG: hypothetical protein A3B54_02930 [Candidatus Curtissbacteria bacterium RIFCSPLOWO2_01_FULL_42_50]
MIKLFLILIFSIIIISKTGWDLPICNIETATLAITPRIFAEQTIDGQNQPVLVTRILHNKAGIFAQEAGRCYFNTLDPNFIASSTTLLGLIFWLYFVYRILIGRIWHLTAIFLLLPVLPFFNLASLIVVYTNKLFAIIGLIFLLVKSK